MKDKFAAAHNEIATSEGDLGAFAKAAEILWQAGLASIPVGGEDGKKPLVRSFTKWKHRPSLKTIRKWIIKYVDANVGVVTGPLSRVSVVDIDSVDPLLQQQVVDRYGDTPLKTRTPSGGCHLWYRHNGEASANFSPDIPVQVKAAGGFVVAPPSVRPSGPMQGVHMNLSRARWRTSLACRLLERGALIALL